MKMRYLCAAALLLAACGGQRQSAAPTPSPAARNPLNVPLYPGATVIATHAFTQTLSEAATKGGLYSGGAGTYVGQEVIAASNASFSQLSSWAQRLGKNPPAGYARVPESWQTHADAVRYGFDYAVFSRGSGKSGHGVLVVVMDPERVNQQFGSVLGVIGRYRMLPEFMRKPIDDQVKQRIGITVSDAMQPTNPIGATLAGLDEFEHRNARGIVIIDAARK